MFAARTGQASRSRHPRRLVRPTLTLAALLLVARVVFSVYTLVQQSWSQATPLPEPTVAEIPEPVLVNALDPTSVADPFQGTVDALSDRLETLGTKLTEQFTGLETRLDEALGADAVIDKSTQDLWREAHALAPDGYDVVLDANGATTLRQSYRHLAPLGRLVVYGFHAMLPKRGGRPNWLRLARDYLRMPRFNPLTLTMNNRSIVAFNLSFLTDRIDLLAPALHRLLRWCAENDLQRMTITAYPFDNVAAAQQDLESGRTVGKLVLTTGETES